MTARVADGVSGWGAEMSYDSKCYDLAEHFLADETNVTAEHKIKLAQYIQNAIEEWLGYDPDAPRKGSTQ